MMETEHTMDAIIAKCLSGVASADEQTVLKNWVDAHSENAAYFEDLKRIYTSLNNQVQAWQPNTDLALEKVKQRIAKKPSKFFSLSAPSFYMAAAAAVVVVISVVLFKMYNTGSPEPVLLSIASVKEIQHNSLPDGSAITLNKGASINYSQKNNRRHVDLQGEAFFNVKHDSLQGFEVQAGDLLISDIGTAFNVKKGAQGDVEVVVTEGEVQLQAHASKALILVAGEAAYYSAASGTLKKIVPENMANVGNYVSRDFEFDSVRLEEIIKQVSESYRVTIKVENTKLKQCLFSVSFHDEELDMVISVIAETLGMQVEEREGVIILKGGVCQ